MMCVHDLLSFVEARMWDSSKMYHENSENLFVNLNAGPMWISQRTHYTKNAKERAYHQGSFKAPFDLGCLDSENCLEDSKFQGADYRKVCASDLPPKALRQADQFAAAFPMRLI